MHNAEERDGESRCSKGEENDGNRRGEEREDAIRLGGLETKNRAGRERRARAARTEAEINRRKSLLPSALSGPFRPAKIIYRKDWSAPPFPVG